MTNVVGAVLLYTDGMTEAQTDGGLLGEAGLSRLVSRCAGRPPGALLACLAAAVHDRDGRGVTDDIAMLALRPARVAMSSAPAARLISTVH